MKTAEEQLLEYLEHERTRLKEEWFLTLDRVNSLKELAEEQELKAQALQNAYNNILIKIDKVKEIA